MNIKSTLKVIDKDLKKLNKNYAKGKIYIEGLVREQQDIMKESEKTINTINIKIGLLRQKLAPYTMEKKLDENYWELKEEYEDLLRARHSLETAINVSAESISEAELTLSEE